MRKEESKPLESEPVEIEIEHFLKLMSIYLSEWNHRATALWNQVFKYFCATLIVIFLPYINSPIDINLPKSAYENFYPWATLLLSGIFLCISFGCAIRAKAAGNRYKNLVKVLPEELRQDSVCVRNHRAGKFLYNVGKFLYNVVKFLYDNMSFLICILMFIVLLFLSFKMHPLS